jgi:hypothetical protein
MSKPVSLSLLKPMLVKRRSIKCIMEEQNMNTKRNNWVSRHQLISFFVLAYAIAYAIALISLYVINIPQNTFFSYVMIFSPTISALVVSAISGGWQGIKKLLSGFTRWKFGFGWVIATLSLTLIPLLVALVYTLLGNTSPGIKPGTTASFLLLNLLYTLINGPLGEETGWRGFALPRLQRRFGALVSSLILGVIWACWHLPFYFISAGQDGIPFYIYVVMVLAITIFITWIYNNTQGNLALCMLAHFCFNFNSAFIVGFLGLLPPMVFYISCGGGLAVYIVIIILVFRAKNLSRKAEAKLVGEAI